jgi:hypothetical protein
VPRAAASIRFDLYRIEHVASREDGVTAGGRALDYTARGVATHKCMADAKHLRLAGGVRRAVAACIGVWLVACGVLASRHEADVAHVRDLRTGAVVHAAHLSEQHDAARSSDFHRQSEPDADHGACALWVASHQAATTTVARPAIAPAIRSAAFVVPLGARGTAAARGVYRLAPKTSPPARA